MRQRGLYEQQQPWRERERDRESASAIGSGSSRFSGQRERWASARTAMDVQDADTTMRNRRFQPAVNGNGSSSRTHETPVSRRASLDYECVEKLPAAPYGCMSDAKDADPLCAAVVQVAEVLPCQTALLAQTGNHRNLRPKATQKLAHRGVLAHRQLEDHLLATTGSERLHTVSNEGLEDHLAGSRMPTKKARCPERTHTSHTMIQRGHADRYRRLHDGTLVQAGTEVPLRMASVSRTE